MLSITLVFCLPNYLHDAHRWLAMRLDAHVICEKPLSDSPWNLDQLEPLESEYGSHCPHRPAATAAQRSSALKRAGGGEPSICYILSSLQYVTRRGPWYHQSWKTGEQVRRFVYEYRDPLF